MPETLPPAPATAPPGGLPAAALVALADRCVQCGLCLPHCPTYRLDRTEAESPRGRINYARAVATGTLAASLAGDAHLDHCLGCRRCEPVCPAGVRYGDLLVAARTAQADRRPAAPMRRLRLALLARPRLLDRLVRAWGRWRPVLGGLGPALPTPPANQPFPPPAAGTSEQVAVFAGCIARPYESGTRAALARLLAAAGVATVLPDGQGCCGAAAAHAGDAEGAAALRAANRTAFAGHPRVLCTASGCHGTLASSLAGVAMVEDPLDLLARSSDHLRFRPAPRRVALHLPCTQRSVVRSGDSLRRLLARVPDLQVVELPDTGCCGAAGLHQLEEPARAAALRRPLLDVLATSGADELLSANLGCRLHLAGGTTIVVRHPLDFLADHLA